MAFSLMTTLESYEYRGIRTGVSQKTGKPWASLVLEDGSANQIEVSVPQDMQSDVYNMQLRKGDFVTCRVNAAARNDGSSWIRLLALPELEYEDGED